jgi:hypothetical protein
MRVLSLSRPWWSSSKITCARGRSRSVATSLDHGRSAIQSRCVRTSAASDDSAFICSSRVTWRRASRAASSGMRAASRRRAELVDVALAVLELAQLLADLLELLAQEVLALRARHLLLGLGLDAVLEGDDLDLFVQGPRDLREPRADLGGLQDELRVGHLQAQIGRHEVGQRAGLVQLEQHREDVGGQRAPRLGQAPQPVAQRADPALDQRIARRHRRVIQRHQARPDQGVVEGQLLGARAAQPLHEHLPLAVRHLSGAQHLAHAAHAVQVIGPRYVRAGRRLRAQEHQLLGAHGGLDGLQRDGARHEQRHHHVREHDEVAHRHER